VVIPAVPDEQRADAQRDDGGVGLPGLRVTRRPAGRNGVAPRSRERLQKPIGPPPSTRGWVTAAQPPARTTAMSGTITIARAVFMPSSLPAAGRFYFSLKPRPEGLEIGRWYE
jgi:hypothetical protein